MTQVTVADGTNIRLAGVLNADNIIGVTDAEKRNKYTALQQCKGAYYEEGNQSNVWWVEIDLGNGVGGWVHAVRISEGGDDQPIPGVPHPDVVVARHVDRWV